MYKYKFNLEHGPKLGIDPIPEIALKKPELLQEFVASASFRTFESIRLPTVSWQWKDRAVNYAIVRQFRWILQDGPFTPETTRKVTITHQEGVSQTHKSTFENTFEVKGNTSVGVPWGKIGVNVRNTLKLTSSDEEKWNVSDTIRTEVTYKGGVTYTRWLLVDELIVNKTVTVQYFWGEHKEKPQAPPEVSDQQGISIYRIINDWGDSGKIPVHLRELAPRSRQPFDIDADVSCSIDDNSDLITDLVFDFTVSNCDYASVTVHFTVTVEDSSGDTREWPGVENVRVRDGSESTTYEFRKAADETVTDVSIDEIKAHCLKS